MLMSRMAMSAWKPAAILAAFAPTTPPPRIVMWAGATPGTPPSRMPRPICGRSRYLAPSWMLIRPATSLIGVSSGSRPLVVGQRFVGDAGRAGLEHRLGQLAVGGEVEIGEEHLPVANQRPLRSACGSFTLTIMSARAKISSGPLDQLAPWPQVIVVGQARAEPGPGLDRAPGARGGPIPRRRPAAWPRGIRPA